MSVLQGDIYLNRQLKAPGLSIDDLNRYLPAIQTSEDISMESENELRDGVFLSKCLDGMSKLPTESIDLIISAPPKEN